MFSHLIRSNNMLLEQFKQTLNDAIVTCANKIIDNEADLNLFKDKIRIADDLVQIKKK